MSKSDAYIDAIYPVAYHDKERNTTFRIIDEDELKRYIDGRTEPANSKDEFWKNCLSEYVTQKRVGNISDPSYDFNGNCVFSFESNYDMNRMGTETFMVSMNIDITTRRHFMGDADKYVGSYRSNPDEFMDIVTEKVGDEIRSIIDDKDISDDLPGSLPKKPTEAMKKFKINPTPLLGSKDIFGLTELEFNVKV